MATKNNDDSVKELSGSDLSEQELKAAIESQVQQAGGRNGDKTETDKKTKSPAANASTDKDKASTPAKTDDKSAEDKGDEGVPIIVKRHAGYINPAGQATPAESDKTSQPETEELKPAKPPSQTQKVVAVPTENQATPKAETATKDGPPEPQPKPVEAPAATTEPAAKPVPVPAQATPVTMADKPPAAVSGLDKKIGQLSQETDKGQPQQQKPTVFDTDQYHLPIKARNRRYVNSTVSWTVLTLVFLGVGGYVLYELGVLDLSRFGL